MTRRISLRSGHPAQISHLNEYTSYRNIDSEYNAENVFLKQDYT